MNNFILFLIPMISSFGLLAGLSLSVTIPLFFIANLFYVNDAFKVDIWALKLEIMFLIWLLISLLWSLSTKTGILSLITIASIFSIASILILNIEIVGRNIFISGNNFMFALLIAITLFFFEYMSSGLVSTSFRKLFQTKDNYKFYLHYLDRGCAFISLFGWAGIAALLKEKKYKSSVIIYILILVMLYISDSLAAFIGFFISAFVFLLTQYISALKPKILALLLVASSIFFISVIFKINPYQISNEYSFLPISAKHRLFIWSYASEKISEKPLLGWGHGSSRAFINAEDAKMIDYENQKLHPLPLHPHNNLVQILLENGIIGGVLYLGLIIKYLFTFDKFTAKHIDKNKYTKSAGYACFSVFFIISMISFNMWQSWWLCSYLWAAFIFCYITVR